MSDTTAGREVGTPRVKRGMAQMLKGGVIMDVVTPDQAKIAEDAGAVAVMALERVPADIRAQGGVARMSDPDLIDGIIDAVSIPVMAKARIGHFVEAQVLQSLGVDYIDESEVLTPADYAHHIDKWAFTVPFVCGATNLGEALRRINEGAQGQKVSSLSEICLLRAYDVAAVTASERRQHMGIALVEGGGTGAAGFWGLPANLALSMLIYFRAVQSVAMFYGYDVKNGPSGELDIASEVFQGALAPKTRTDVISEYIGKTLVYAESAAVKQATKRGWAAMVEQGGAALTIARIRALANGPARKAVERGGQKALEAGVFKKALAQVGQKMSLKTVGKMVPVIGAGFGALFDTAQMRRILNFADIFYHVRFINEKEERAQRLIEQSPFAKETQNKSS